MPAPIQKRNCKIWLKRNTPNEPQYCFQQSYYFWWFFVGFFENISVFIWWTIWSLYLLYVIWNHIKCDLIIRKRKNDEKNTEVLKKYFSFQKNMKIDGIQKYLLIIILIFLYTWTIYRKYAVLSTNQTHSEMYKTSDDEFKRLTQYLLQYRIAYSFSRFFMVFFTGNKKKYIN